MVAILLAIFPQVGSFLESVNSKNGPLAEVAQILRLQGAAKLSNVPGIILNVEIFKSLTACYRFNAIGTFLSVNT
jgi:hypothetical protein